MSSFCLGFGLYPHGRFLTECIVFSRCATLYRQEAPMRLGIATTTAATTIWCARTVEGEFHSTFHLFMVFVFLVWVYESASAGMFAFYLHNMLACIIFLFTFHSPLTHSSYSEMYLPIFSRRSHLFQSVVGFHLFIEPKIGRLLAERERENE